MAIVDAQIHLWSKGEPLPPHRSRPFLVDEAVAGMDAAGIDGAIIHPPYWDPDSNELAIEAVKRFPERFRILGNFPLDVAANRSLVGAWLNRFGMVGLRFYFIPEHMRTWPTDGTIDWLWPAAEQAGVPIALLVDGWFDRLGEIARAYPRLRLTIDHMGARRVPGGGAAAFDRLPAVLGLAKYPNVSVKLTGGPFYANDAFPYRSLWPRYRRLIDAFGPQRVFWGTDITKMPGNWKDCVEHMLMFEWRNEHERNLVMGDAAVDWFGWKCRPGVSGGCG